MNMEGKIIAVWGSPNSGKTTFATKLARAIHASYQANVIVLYCDLETPTLPVLFPNEKSENLGSVGKVLTKTEVEKVDILANAMTFKQFDGLCFLGYKDGENKFTYPKFGRAKAEDLLNALCEIASYVIVDCTSNLENSILSATAIEKAEQILRLTSPDLKAISFYLSQLPVYADAKYQLDNHILGVNTPNEDVFMPIEETKRHVGEVSFTVPFCKEMKEQLLEGRLYAKTNDKKFELRMKEIADKVVSYGTDRTL